jgi:hypothetical protein
VAELLVVMPHAAAIYPVFSLTDELLPATVRSCPRSNSNKKRWLFLSLSESRLPKRSGRASTLDCQTLMSKRRYAKLFVATRSCLPAQSQVALTNRLCKQRVVLLDATDLPRQRDQRRRCNLRDRRDTYVTSQLPSSACHVCHAFYSCGADTDRSSSHRNLAIVTHYWNRQPTTDNQ